MYWYRYPFLLEWFVSRCFLHDPRFTNSFLQMSHLHCFSLLECVSLCCCRCWGRLNVASHSSHLYSRTPWWRKLWLYTDKPEKNTQKNLLKMMKILQNYTISSVPLANAKKLVAKLPEKYGKMAKNESSLALKWLLSLLIYIYVGLEKRKFRA